MAPYTRTVLLETTEGPGVTRTSRARLDDPFHGFEVVLELAGDSVVGARATAHRQPWTTCSGALSSVEQARGPVGQAAGKLFDLARDHTCVHVNDLVWLASRGHRRCRYDVEVTPHTAFVRRDGEPVVGWRLQDWVVASPGPFEGWHVADRRWRDHLEGLDADDPMVEVWRVVRRSVAVAIGYFELDWASFDTAADIDVAAMADTCHTFTERRVALARRLAVPPDTTLFR